MRDSMTVIRHAERPTVAFPGGATYRPIIGDDTGNSVFAWRRVDGAGRELITVCNFTPVPRHGYRVGFPRAGRWVEVLNTDAGVYGGSNVGNGGVIYTDEVAAHGRPQSAALVLPPLGTVVLRAD